MVVVLEVLVSSTLELCHHYIGHQCNGVVGHLVVVLIFVGYQRRYIVQ